MEPASDSLKQPWKAWYRPIAGPLGRRMVIPFMAAGNGMKLPLSSRSYIYDMIDVGLHGGVKAAATLRTIRPAVMTMVVPKGVRR